MSPINPKAQHILRMGGKVTIGDYTYVIDGDGVVGVGDLYIAERNTEPELLTAQTIDDRGWIVANELAYCYDEWECVKVRKAEDYDL